MVYMIGQTLLNVDLFKNKMMIIIFNENWQYGIGPTLIQHCKYNIGNKTLVQHWTNVNSLILVWYQSKFAVHTVVKKK